MFQMRLAIGGSLMLLGLLLYVVSATSRLYELLNDWHEESNQPPITR